MIRNCVTSLNDILSNVCNIMTGVLRDSRFHVSHEGDRRQKMGGGGIKRNLRIAPMQMQMSISQVLSRLTHNTSVYPAKEGTLHGRVMRTRGLTTGVLVANRPDSPQHHSLCHTHSLQGALTRIETRVPSWG